MMRPNPDYDPNVQIRHEEERQEQEPEMTNTICIMMLYCSHRPVLDSGNSPAADGDAATGDQTQRAVHRG